MFKNSLLRALVVLGMGIALVMYSNEVARLVVQGIGVLFILPGLITAYGGISKDKYENSVPLMPIVVGGGSVILGAILLLFPELFISALLYILAGLLLLGSTMQIYQLVKLHQEGMKSSMIYYLFPATIFVVGLYIMLHPMEAASLPFLFVGYAAILFSVIELLMHLRVSSFRRGAGGKADEAKEVAPEEVKPKTEAPAIEAPKAPAEDA